jgi:hypothetical protein
MLNHRRFRKDTVFCSDRKIEFEIGDRVKSYDAIKGSYEGVIVDFERSYGCLETYGVVIYSKERNDTFRSPLKRIESIDPEIDLIYDDYIATLGFKELYKNHLVSSFDMHGCSLFLFLLEDDYYSVFLSPAEGKVRKLNYAGLSKFFNSKLEEETYFKSGITYDLSNLILNDYDDDLKEL